MAISFVGAASVRTATSITIPAHQVGDLILIFAYRDGSNTAPPVPAASGTVPTWTQIGTSSGANTNSSRLHYAVATATNTTSGTWTNATGLVVQVYRGAGLPGANGITSSSSSNTITYPALTLQKTDGSSWVAAFAGHRAINSGTIPAPAGMTNRTVNTGTVEVAGHDTNGGVTSWSATNTTISGATTGNGYQARTVEIKEAALLTADAGSLAVSGVATPFYELSPGIRRPVTVSGWLTGTADDVNEVTPNGANFVDSIKDTASTTFINLGSISDIASTGNCTLRIWEAFSTGAPPDTNNFGSSQYSITMGGYTVVGSTTSTKSTTTWGQQSWTFDASNLSLGSGIVPVQFDITVSGSFTRGFAVAWLEFEYPVAATNTSIVADVGAFTNVGIAAGLVKTSRLVAETRAFSVVGNAASVERDARLVAAQGTYQVTGNSANFPRTYRLLGNSRSYVLTGVASNRLVTRRLSCSPGTYAVTGNAATLRATKRLVGAAASFTLTGVSALLYAGRYVGGAPGAFTLTGQSAVIKYGSNQSLVADAGSFAITGNDVTFAYGQNVTLTAEAGSYTLTGVAAVPKRNALIAADVRAFTVTGNAASLLAGRKLTAAPATYASVGNEVTIKLARLLGAGLGSFTVVGVNAAFGKTYAIITDPTTYLLFGIRADIIYSGGPPPNQDRKLRYSFGLEELKYLKIGEAMDNAGLVYRAGGIYRIF